ncbi:MAG: tRNA uridine(34) 5-carboxymethylaminomethyl modification radical SAM/GNAT enzyme Elp3 [bacterium]|nr:tRNA uridine(34) 5-carboxymethylaminomethyl modification radical SAM/GNAT enzyme Elp3 [bacterium]
MRPSPHHFEPRLHEAELLPIIDEIRALDTLDANTLHRLVRQYPKEGRGAFSKSEIIRGYRFFRARHGWDEDEAAFVERVRMKPVRTQSGVAPVTVLTKPYPCPGKCIFCPSDVRMPKSYLSREPGAQRAAQHDFDPYGQTLGRLLAYYNTGHEVDKVELIILGGTWSFYPEPYQIWFVKRCFDALNAVSRWRASGATDGSDAASELRPWEIKGAVSFDALIEEVDGRAPAKSYNQVVRGYLAEQLDGALLDASEHATWEELEEVQRFNETGEARCVGLVVETRPDHLSDDEVVRIRRLGGTKVQIGYQSLSDEVLEANRRGHDVAATRHAMKLLRAAGFKLHAHWMPNLYGSDPERDVEDFDRVFSDPDLRPDELKIYPTSLIESAELMRYYESGDWRPYTEAELLEVLSECLVRVPEYCRVTRVIRDIPGDDIHAGNKVTNFREVVEKELRRGGRASRDIRAREIRGERVRPEDLHLESIEYATSIGREVFLQFVTRERRIVGFCRLALPAEQAAIDEIAASAMIREVHVYGAVVGLDDDRRRGRSQHLGLGTRLIEEAATIASAAGFADLAVISSVGTREYYRRLGFADGELYQHRSLRSSS